MIKKEIILTQRQIKALAFWANVGVEWAWSGQYGNVVAKTIEDITGTFPHWGKRIPAHLDLAKANNRIQELEKILGTMHQDIGNKDARIAVLESANKSLRKPDPLRELLTNGT